MKEFAAFVLLILLVIAGWNQPYKAHFDSLMGNPPPATTAPVVAPAAASVAPPTAPATAPAIVQTLPAATPVRDASWMQNRTTMDAPPPSTTSKGGPSRGR